MAKILIADDHENGRTILRTILTQQGGWTVCGEAVNGLEAVRLASELKPDLIVLDFSMPILDGVQAAREILRSTPAVPIVLFTLHYSPQLEAEATRAGVRKVISKGNGASPLIAALEESLGRVNPAVGPLAIPADESVIPAGPPATEEVGPLAVPPPSVQPVEPLVAASDKPVEPAVNASAAETPPKPQLELES